MQLQEARAVAAKALAASQESCHAAGGVKACARIEELVHTLGAQTEEPSAMSGSEVLDETWVSEEVKIPRSVPHFHIGDDSVLGAEDINAAVVREPGPLSVSATLTSPAEETSKSDDASTSDGAVDCLNCYSPSSSSNYDLADDISSSVNARVPGHDLTGERIIPAMAEPDESDSSSDCGQQTESTTDCSLNLVAAKLSPIKQYEADQSRARTENAHWQPNTSDCSICKAAFSIFNMRHHCRKCGRNICSSCSPFRMALDAPLHQPATPLQRLIDTAVQRALTPNGLRRTESAASDALPARPTQESKRRHRATSRDRARSRAWRSGSRERSVEQAQAHRVCFDCHSQSLAPAKIPRKPPLASMRKGKVRDVPASPNGLSMDFSMRLAFGGA